MIPRIPDTQRLFINLAQAEKSCFSFLSPAHLANPTHLYIKYFRTKKPPITTVFTIHAEKPNTSINNEESTIVNTVTITPTHVYLKKLWCFSIFCLTNWRISPSCIVKIKSYRKRAIRESFNYSDSCCSSSLRILSNSSLVLFLRV